MVEGGIRHCVVKKGGERVVATKPVQSLEGFANIEKSALWLLLLLLLLHVQNVLIPHIWSVKNHKIAAVPHLPSAADDFSLPHDCPLLPLPSHAAHADRANAPE